MTSSIQKNAKECYLKLATFDYSTYCKYSDQELSLHFSRLVSDLGFDIKKLCLLSYDVIIDTTFKTYLPNYLRRSGLETRIIDAISRGIEQC